MILERMTPAEKDICRYVQSGRTNREIAELVHSSRFMVQKRLRWIFEKAGVESRLQLANVLTVEELADPVVRCRLAVEGWKNSRME